MCRLLTAKSRSAREASYHLAFMVSYLTINQMHLPCPPCGKMRLLKSRFNTVEMPNLLCLPAAKMAYTNYGGDHEVMCRWRQLTLADWEELRMWERWSWSLWADCWGWVWFSANACLWICWRWGTSMGVAWATMGTFYWKSMGQRRGRNRRPNLVEGGGRGRGRDRTPNFVACGGWIFSGWVVVAWCAWLFVKCVRPVHVVDRYGWMLGRGDVEENVLCRNCNRKISSLEFDTWQ